MDLYDGVLRAIDSNGQIIFDGVAPSSYQDQLIEEVRSWTYMKFPHIRSLGREHRVRVTGGASCTDQLCGVGRHAAC